MTERILSCPFPANLNPLTANCFKFSIQKLPDVSYFMQQVALPSVQLGESIQSSNFVDAPLPGDRMTFDPLEITFIVDTAMANYTSIFNWIQGLGTPESHAQHAAFMAASDRKVYSDATLQVLDPLGNSVKAIQFVDVFPISLSALSFRSDLTDSEHLIATATFRYTLYKFV